MATISFCLIEKGVVEMAKNSIDPFKDVVIATIPLSKASVKFEGYEVSKGFRSQVWLVDRISEKPKDAPRGGFPSWMVDLTIEMTEFGKPEVLLINISGSTYDVPTDENFRHDDYVHEDAQAIQRWQLKFIDNHFPRLMGMSLFHFIQTFFYTGEGWGASINRVSISPKYKSRIEKHEEGSLRQEIDKRLHTKLDLDFLKKVAIVYSNAVTSGYYPSQEVSNYFGVPKGTAQRWAGLCRKAGLLPELEKSISNKSNAKLLETNKKKGLSQ
jgi:hypothetical protein